MNIPDEPHIWVTVSYTVNLGNYESAKIEIGSSSPANSNIGITKQREAISKELMDQVIDLGEEMRKKAHAERPRFHRVKNED
jgi:hypothetical protein